MKERVNKFKADYTLVPHLRNAPDEDADVLPLRDGRRAAVLKHAPHIFADNEFGRAACTPCTLKNHGATRCRVKGEGCSGHGVVRDKYGGGGPDFDFEHFPVGCHVSCTAPQFAGTVTHFDHRSGRHTLALDGGAGERREFLGYLWQKCTVRGASRCARCRAPAAA